VSARRFYRGCLPFAVAVSLFALMLTGLGLVLGWLAFFHGPSADVPPPRDSSTLSPGAALAFCLLFALVGAFLMLMPWVSHRLSRKLLGYAVTSRRALVVVFREGHKSIVESFPPDRINMIVARVYPDGFGNVWISSRVSTAKAHGISFPAGITWKGFLDTPDARGAAQALATLVNITPEIRPAFFSRLFRGPAAPRPAGTTAGPGP
jgi:hypothetical protein